MTKTRSLLVFLSAGNTKKLFLLEEYPLVIPEDLTALNLSRNNMMQRFSSIYP
jgi:hypothetical protein